MMNREAQRLGHEEHAVRERDRAARPAALLDRAATSPLLAAALIRDFPGATTRCYSQREFRYNNITQPNRNRLLWIDPNVDGVKTGHTEAAGYCLVASARRGERRLLSVRARRDLRGGARARRARSSSTTASSSSTACGSTRRARRSGRSRCGRATRDELKAGVDARPRPRPCRKGDARQAEGRPRDASSRWSRRCAPGQRVGVAARHARRQAARRVPGGRARDRAGRAGIFGRALGYTAAVAAKVSEGTHGAHRAT